MSVYKEKEIYKLIFGEGSDEESFEVGQSDVVKIELSPLFYSSNVMRVDEYDKVRFGPALKASSGIIPPLGKEFWIYIANGNIIQAFPEKPIFVYWRDK